MSVPTQTPVSFMLANLGYPSQINTQVLGTKALESYCPYWFLLSKGGYYTQAPRVSLIRWLYQWLSTEMSRGWAEMSRQSAAHIKVDSLLWNDEEREGEGNIPTFVLISTIVAPWKQEEWWNQTLSWLEVAQSNHLLWASVSPSWPVWIKPAVPLRDGMVTQEMHVSCPGHGSCSRAGWFDRSARDRVGSSADHSGKPTGRKMYLEGNITLPSSDIQIS